MVRLLPLMVAVFILAGCGGPAAPPQVQVKGTVTLDQKPLKEGEITFSTPGKSPETLPINNGEFQGMVQVGEKRVEIAAYKDAPPPPPMEGVTFEPSKINYLPARYHSDSTLKASVTAQGPNEFKFEVKSK